MLHKLLSVTAVWFQFSSLSVVCYQSDGVWHYDMISHIQGLYSKWCHHDHSRLSGKQVRIWHRALTVNKKSTIEMIKSCCAIGWRLKNVKHKVLLMLRACRFSFSYVWMNTSCCLCVLLCSCSTARRSFGGTPAPTGWPSGPLSSCIHKHYSESVK